MAGALCQACGQNSAWADDIAIQSKCPACGAEGRLRPDVTAGDLVEAIAGLTLMAIITRNQALDDAWVERTATLITKGISA